jgi:transposase
MSKSFRAWRLDQTLLLPPSVHDFVPAGHLCRFVVALVSESLDLSEIVASYKGEKGQPPYHPAMMVGLLLYSYACGIYSSRRIAKACGERVDFMSIVGFDAPDFRTISEFRRRHLKALGALFVQILQLCEKAGLVKLGHVAFDGSKIKANASKHKAMSYERMEKRACELEAEVAKWFAAAEASDAKEDKLYGADKSGEEMPDWVADKKRRAERIRQAKAELEAEAKAAAEAKLKAQCEATEKRQAEGGKKSGRPAAPPSTAPDPKAQKNFTDPESRIMKSKDGFVQAYNAQIAIDSEAQIIVAQDVTQSGSDTGQLVPMLDATKDNLGRYPVQASADAGYCSEANLEALENRSIDGYVATGRARDAVADNVKGGNDEAPGAPPQEPQVEPKPAATPTRVEAMRAKLKAGGHASPYRLRKQLPEPVFGQIKQARGFRQFLLRGFDNVRAEWAIICTAHNLLKLAQGWTPFAARLQAA